MGEPTEAALKCLAEKMGTDSPTFNKQHISSFPTIKALEKLSPAEKATKCGQVSDYVESKYERTATLEFSRDRKSMSVLVERLEGAPAFGSTPTAASGKVTRSSSQSQSRILFVKGAPESVLERCSFVRCASSPDKQIPLTPALKAMLLDRVHNWADAECLRVLAFATVEKPNIPEKLSDSTQYAKYEVKKTVQGYMGLFIF